MYIIMTVLNACIHLSGSNESDYAIKGHEELERIGTETSNTTLTWHNVMNQMCVCFWMRKFELVEYISQKHKPMGHKHVTRYNRLFMEGISSLYLARTCQQDTERRIAVGKEAAEYFEKMSNDVSTWNFEHRAKLLRAEWSYLNRNLESAEQLYVESIKSAREHKFENEEALAYELHGMFCLENQMVGKGLQQLKLALDGYKKWGATKKAEMLQQSIDPTDYLRGT